MAATSSIPCPQPQKFSPSDAYPLGFCNTAEHERAVVAPTEPLVSFRASNLVVQGLYRNPSGPDRVALEGVHTKLQKECIPEMSGNWCCTSTPRVKATSSILRGTHEQNSSSRSLGIGSPFRFGRQTMGDMLWSCEGLLPPT
jgi:hypothetical protein